MSTDRHFLVIRDKHISHGIYAPSFPRSSNLATLFLLSLRFTLGPLDFESVVSRLYRSAAPVQTAFPILILSWITGYSSQLTPAHLYEIVESKLTRIPYVWR